MIQNTHHNVFFVVKFKEVLSNGNNVGWCTYERKNSVYIFMSIICITTNIYKVKSIYVAIANKQNRNISEIIYKSC
jgi:hypothetical protein